MQAFINNLIDFIIELRVAIRAKIANLGTGYLTEYNGWLTKNVFSENSIIGINITWDELLLYATIYILLILFIVLFVKFILKLVSIFRV